MQQVTIFDVFDDLDEEIKIQEIIDRSLITVDGIEVDKNKIVAVCVPAAPRAEASVATLENGSYRHYRFIHGHLYDDTLHSKWIPGYYWTWLTKE